MSTVAKFFRRCWLDMTRPIRTCVWCGRRSRMGVLYSARVNPIVECVDGKWRCRSHHEGGSQ